MKAIYFNNRYELNVNSIDTSAGQTLLFTTIEEFAKIKETHNELLKKLETFHRLQIALHEADSKNLISQKLWDKLTGLL
jgi:hypothetical protein